MNRKRFGFEEGLLDQAPVDFWREREREERAGSYFGMRERNEEEAYLGSCVAV